MKKLKVAILGSGNIGTDLLLKCRRSASLEPVVLSGRRKESPGLELAQSLGIDTTWHGVEALLYAPEAYDLVFDCTNAVEAKENAPNFKALGKKVIDLTPARVGPMAVPVLNRFDMLQHPNVNMVTCGGQASIPLAWALGKVYGKALEYVEVVSSIASKSAGPATRANLDEYIETTERGLAAFSGCEKTKAILNLNPADPCVDMQTTVLAKLEPRQNAVESRLVALTRLVTDIAADMKEYVPGYEVIVPPTMEGGRIVIMVRVRGLGDYLPAYAGNLDIINCAALAMAEEHAVDAAIDRSSK